MAAEPAARRATITDVASRANVSTAAVSKVLRNAYGVSPAMQERVRQAIAELGYRPQAAARGMRGRTYTIGVLIPDLRNPFFPELVEGIAEHLATTEYQPLLGPGGSSPQSQSRMTDALLDRRMDGIIMIAPQQPRARLEEIAASVPLVVIGRHGKSTEYDAVNDDDLAGAGLIVDHLADLGHRRIAHVEHRDSTRGIPTTMPQTVRAEGYRQAMQRRGLEIDIVSTSYSEEGGHTAAREMLARPVRPTAIFAGADIAAIGVLNAVHEAGLRIPEDISVVGYDDEEISRHLHPRLTTTILPHRAMGQWAIEQLTAGIERRERHPVTKFECALVERDSVAPPARTR